jgi:hypothetical protein
MPDSRQATPADPVETPPMPEDEPSLQAIRCAVRTVQARLEARESAVPSAVAGQSTQEAVSAAQVSGPRAAPPRPPRDEVVSVPVVSERPLPRPRPPRRAPDRAHR